LSKALPHYHSSASHAGKNKKESRKKENNVAEPYNFHATRAPGKHFVRPLLQPLLRPFYKASQQFLNEHWLKFGLKYFNFWL
jgi:hypothetical protein